MQALVTYLTEDHQNDAQAQMRQMQDKMRI